MICVVIVNSVGQVLQLYFMLCLRCYSVSLFCSGCGLVVVCWVVGAG